MDDYLRIKELIRNEDYKETIEKLLTLTHPFLNNIVDISTKLSELEHNKYNFSSTVSELNLNQISESLSFYLEKIKNFLTESEVPLSDQIISEERGNFE